MNKKYINPKTGEKYLYYDRNGKGLDLFAFAKLMEPKYYKNAEEYSKAKVVKQEATWMGFRVSTVWLGIDYSFHSYDDPLIFETMVFGHRGYSNLYCNRYTTEKEAMDGHKKVVRNWSNPFYVVRSILDDKTWHIRFKLRNLNREKVNKK